jgi:hypothetical protein
LGDAVALCEAAKICPIKDCTGNCSVLNEVTLRPQKVVTNDNVQLNVSYTVFQPFGAGMVQYRILDDQNQMVAINVHLEEEFQPGTGATHFEFPIDDHFEPGTYTVEVKICEGSCEYPTEAHTVVYDTKTIPLFVTE